MSYLFTHTPSHPPRATLELQWRHRGGEHRTLFEALSTRNKEKDRELK